MRTAGESSSPEEQTKLEETNKITRETQPRKPITGGEEKEGGITTNKSEK